MLILWTLVANMCYLHLLRYMIQEHMLSMYVCMQFDSNSSIICHDIPPPTGPGTSIAASQKGKQKKGEERTETVKIHNTTPGPNVRRKRKGQGKKKKTHYYVYMVESEKVDNNTTGHAAESETKRIPKKPEPMRNIIKM